MRPVPRSRIAMIRLAHPNAHIAVRDGHEVIVIPTYDATTDEAGEIVRRIGDDPPEGKPQVGEIRRDVSGNTYQIMPPPQPDVRQGPTSDE